MPALKAAKSFTSIKKASIKLAFFMLSFSYLQLIETLTSQISKGIIFAQKVQGLPTCLD